ncbi:MAG TPA: SET domain-containing protein [Parasegetibacter sp.]|jgi:SET domain-containing protein
MILPCLYVAETADMGRGVFTNRKITAGEVVEISPVIVLTAEERKLIDQTLLHDYIFEWGEDRTLCAVALGYVSIYNHSYESNCEYEMDYAQRTMQIKAVRDIEEGEELLINYNGDWDNDTPLWFEAR